MTGQHLLNTKYKTVEISLCLNIIIDTSIENAVYTKTNNLLWLKCTQNMRQCLTAYCTVYDIIIPQNR